MLCILWSRSTRIELVSTIRLTLGVSPDFEAGVVAAGHHARPRLVEGHRPHCRRVSQTRACKIIRGMLRMLQL